MKDAPTQGGAMTTEDTECVLATVFMPRPILNNDRM